MDRDTWLIVLGSAIALLSSLFTTILTAYISHRFELHRQVAERKRDLQDKKQELRLAILKEKFEPALDLIAANLKIMEIGNADEAFKQLEALSKQRNYWVVWARLADELTDETVNEYASIAVRYHRIKESEEQWRDYKVRLMSAAKELNKLYDQERERLFGEKETASD